MRGPRPFKSKDLRPQPSTVQLRQLKATNDWRRIRKQCMPLFDLAKGKSLEAQSAIHTTMIHQIAAVLDIEPTAHDFDPHPHFSPRLMMGFDPAFNGGAEAIIFAWQNHPVIVP